MKTASQTGSRRRGSVGRHGLALTLASAAAAAVAPARASGPPPPQASQLPPIGVELVKVDAVVTDKAGRPVSGLTALDFEVKEDGKTQALVYFGVEEHAGTGATAPVQAPPPKGLAPDLIPPPAPPPAGRSKGRAIVLFVDDLHITAQNVARARAALLKLVDEQIVDDDAVALVTTNGSVVLTQALTSDRAALRVALERLSLVQERRVEVNETPHLTEYQAEMIDRGDPEATRLAVQEILQANPDIGESLALLQARQRAQSMLVEIMNYSGQTLRALEQVVRTLAPLPARKMVVLLSDGFLVGLGASDSRHFDLRRVTDAATRSGVVVYALDTAGLVAEAPGGNASFTAPPVITAPGVRESLQGRSIEALRDGMVALSEDTGGFLARSGNDLSVGLGRILGDSRLYYQFAYQPANAGRDGKFRRIEVKLRNRPGLRVRARRGYYAADKRTAAAVPETAAARREREIAQGLHSLLPLDGIPMRLVADFVDLPPDGPRALVKAHVDVSRVGFERRIDHYTAELELAGAVYDEAGAVTAVIPGETSLLKLPSADYETLKRGGLLYEKAVTLRPGRYLVKLVARNPGSGLLGNAGVWVEVPDRNSRPLSLSGAFLKADNATLQPGEQAALEDVQVEKRFKRGQGLHYVVYVYRSDQAAAAAAPGEVVVQAQVWSGDKLMGVGPKHKVAFGAADAPPPRVAERIALEGLGAGVFELRLVAMNGVTGHKAVRRMPFTID
jgi:VWFA-related protein